MRIRNILRNPYGLPILVACLGIIAITGRLLERTFPSPHLNKQDAIEAPAQFQGEVESVGAADTLHLKDGRIVRLAGVDAPYPKSPLAKKAASFVEMRVLGRQVQVEVCSSHPTDKKGRVLATVSVQGADLGLALMERSLAKIYASSRCLETQTNAYWKAALDSFQEGRGVWKYNKEKEITDKQAVESVKKFRIVSGTIGEVREMKKLSVFHMDGGFRFVIFKGDRERFVEMFPENISDLNGQKIRIFGRIVDYNGPEMVLSSPVQILSTTSGP